MTCCASHSNVECKVQRGRGKQELAQWPRSVIVKFTFYYSVYAILLVVIEVRNLSFSPVMAEKKKEKIDYECRQFQDE